MYKMYYYLIISFKHIIRYFLYLTILFNVQKLSISPGNRSVNRSINNLEFLSCRFPRRNLRHLLIKTLRIFLFLTKKIIVLFVRNF